ncbi:MAG: hypothetical protein GX682_03200 [Clostridiaceae bacterium]|nr:hypothetical protein [Clostridiaceae bacterium]
MKKQVKIITTVLMVLAIICTLTNMVCASQVITSLQGDQTSKVSSQQLTNLGGKIIGILQVVGIVIAVVVLLVLGIKYMIGSAEEKAEYKKTMIPYLVGALLIFAASSIVSVVYNMFSNINVA